jgi:hypothetical protein
MPPEKDKSSLLWLWIVLGVGAVVGLIAVLGGGTIIAMLLLGWSSAKMSSKPVMVMSSTSAGDAQAKSFTEAPKAALLSREDFKAKVMGKTTAEVTKAVGKPDSTIETGTTKRWSYDRKTVDPVTNKPDSRAQVVFENDKVARIGFSSD